MLGVTGPVTARGRRPAGARTPRVGAARAPSARRRERRRCDLRSTRGSPTRRSASRRRSTPSPANERSPNAPASTPSRRGPTRSATMTATAPEHKEETELVLLRRPPEQPFGGLGRPVEPANDPREVEGGGEVVVGRSEVVNRDVRGRQAAYASATTAPDTSTARRRPFAGDEQRHVPSRRRRAGPRSSPGLWPRRRASSARATCARRPATNAPTRPPRPRRTSRAGRRRIRSRAGRRRQAQLRARRGTAGGSTV